MNRKKLNEIIISLSNTANMIEMCIDLNYENLPDYINFIREDIEDLKNL